MTDLVTLDRVKQALRVDANDDDALLTAYIAAASAAIVGYLKSAADDFGDEGAEIPPAVEVAAIMLVGRFYNEPDGDSEKSFERGYLPAPVTALLYPLRDPALK